MIVKGCSSSAQLKQISIFQDLATTQLESLVPYSYVREYQQDEIVMQECDRFFFVVFLKRRDLEYLF